MGQLARDWSRCRERTGSHPWMGGLCAEEPPTIFGRKMSRLALRSGRRLCQQRQGSIGNDPARVRCPNARGRCFEERPPRSAAADRERDDENDGRRGRYSS